MLNSAKLLGAAKHLEMSGMVEKIKAEIETLRKGLTSAEDAAAVLEEFGKDHPARIGLINSLANAVVDGKLSESNTNVIDLEWKDDAFSIAFRAAVQNKRARIQDAKANKEEGES